MNKEQGFLLLVLALSGMVSLLIVLPFLQYILAATLLAYVLTPLNERLRPTLGPRLAPAAVILVAAVIVVPPIAYLIAVVIRDLISLSDGSSGLDTTEIETTVRETTGQEIDLTEVVNALGGELLEVLFADAAAIVSFGFEFSLGLALALFVVYYLLRDGDRFVEWIVDIAPMGNSVCTRLLSKIDNTTRGVVNGHLAVAVLQGLVGGVGLFVAGVPNPAFWTFAMIALSLLPLIGAFLVWAPAAAYLFAVGQSTAGIFLFAYGAIVVSLVDNYARPLFIDRKAELNPAVIIIGVFGGTYALGVTGLFLGPIVLAVFAATIATFDEEYEALRSQNRGEQAESEGVSGE